MLLSFKVSFFFKKDIQWEAIEASAKYVSFTMFQLSKIRKNPFQNIIKFL